MDEMPDKLNESDKSASSETKRPFLFAFWQLMIVTAAVAFFFALATGRAAAVACVLVAAIFIIILQLMLESFKELGSANSEVKPKKLFRFSMLALVFLPVVVGLFYGVPAQVSEIIIVVGVWLLLLAASVTVNVVIKFIQGRYAPPTSKTETKRPFQYSVRALLILTTAIAVLLALAVQAHFLFTFAFFILFSMGLTVWLRSVWPIIPFILLFIFVMAAAPVILRVREAARHNTCSSNIRQLALAMHNYESGNRKYPSQNYFTGRRLGNVSVNNVPGATTGGAGTESSHSFIMQLVPQFESCGPDMGPILATNPFSVSIGTNQYSPNAAYAGTPIPVLQCPSYAGSRETVGADYVQFNSPSWTIARKPMLTQYVAMGATTHNSLYRTAKATTSEPDGMIFSNKETTTDDVSDGLANTIILCETREEKYAVWMDGTTASVFGITAGGQTTINLGGSAAPYIPAANFGGTEDWQWGPSSMHPGMANHAFGDGTVHSISDHIAPAVYEALITRGGNDTETADSFFDE